MRNIRELVGSLTQARVQLTAAQAIITNEMAQDALEGGEMNALKVVELNVQKLSRCTNIIRDVRDWVNNELQRPNQEPPKGENDGA